MEQDEEGRIKDDGEIDGKEGGMKEDEEEEKEKGRV